MDHSPPSLRANTNRPPSNAYAVESYVVGLLAKATAANATDVHFKVGQPPCARVGGVLVHFQTDRLLANDTAEVARHIMLWAGRDPREVTGDRGSTAAGLRTEGARAVELSIEVPNVGRFRVSFFRQRGSVAIVMHAIPREVSTLEKLGLPPIAAEMAQRSRGLIVVAGAAGQGKSTTLAAMIEQINRTQAVHIVTIEDPIEVIFRDDRASISQREVGADTPTTGGALRAALRHDPDVIMVSDLRDADTLDAAIAAAEAGHLVLASMATPDVDRTVLRLVGLAAAPGPNQGLRDERAVRERIAGVLQGILAQRLVPRRDGGTTVVTEALAIVPAAREALRRASDAATGDGAHTPTLRDLMEHTFVRRAEELVAQGVIDASVVAQLRNPS